MPEAYVVPPTSATVAARYSADLFAGRYGTDHDLGDASTLQSTQLDEELQFRLAPELGHYSLTAMSSYDDVSQL